MMDIRAIRTQTDYQWALREIEHYFNHQPDVGTPDGPGLRVLAQAPLRVR